ncbi:ADP-polyphosphate phosphotransferase [Thauera sp.]|uniref:ADP-polyphosphate phosphotransferase n=1 Tax=Thauera sp. TaxID=1905334 RepID=UPI001B52AD70|nr:ADP-polyphosphate phosphotransferase [Thauera sp.]MBP6131673.1 polyphosphate kinase 2 family protein [Thauera sp.]MBP7047163.1 polyphosphate kinase 2 family protein [Thauera sp.]
MSKHKPIDIAEFRVEGGKKVDLADWPTKDRAVYDSKSDYEERLDAGTERLAELQEMLYAHDRYSLLVIFQAMDAAGKDGAIRHVMSGINPQGCQVFSFKHPSPTELDHDFLWRTHVALPERGRIGIFNRSYYEEVLIVRVLPEILHGQQLPDETLAARDFWGERFRSIVDAEAHLHRNGTRIVKIFLHLSKDEQRDRLIARIDEEDKNWKFDEGDIEQRKHWDKYMAAYADCLRATSTPDCPWYVVPADDKKNARLIVSQILVDTLAGLDLHYPETSPARREKLLEIRRQLEAGEV